MKALAKHLIVVAGQATFRWSITRVPRYPTHDKYWVLLPFQAHEPPYYIEHIKKGVELLREDPASLLIFSGGRTRLEGGTWSEATTYAAIARYYDYWADDPKLAAKHATRVELETYARDSFENLLFSLFRFYQLTGAYPEHVRVVGWEFKAQRFDFHRQTLHIPPGKFTFVGVNNPDQLADALQGERRALAEFRQEPWGTQGPLLEKRQARNPFHEQNPYTGCPPVHLA